MCAFVCGSQSGHDAGAHTHSPPLPPSPQGKKYVVLFFYPLDWTFVCPTEITAFDDRIAEFEKLGAGE